MFFTDKLNKALTLFTALLLTVTFWMVLHLPEINLLWITFTILTSAMLFDVPDYKKRFIIALVMSVYAGTAQFLTGITWQTPFLRIVLQGLFAYFTLITLPDRQGASIVLLTGYLACFAPGGTTAALFRCIDFGISAIFILLATSLNGIIRITPPGKNLFSTPCPAVEAFVITTELTAGAICSQFLNFSQGTWIMMTVMFIQMSANARHPVRELALQRIFAIPAGILLAGLYLGTFCSLDYRFVYLLPFAGTATFFVYYYTDNYFLFSLLFIFSMTIASDWLLGTYQRYHFSDIMLGRSFATLAGAFLSITGELFLKKEKTV
jgi:uncharacterized membrane protein YccC